jgi:hypothetical protein
VRAFDSRRGHSSIDPSFFNLFIIDFEGKIYRPDWIDLCAFEKTGLFKKEEDNFNSGFAIANERGEGQALFKSLALFVNQIQVKPPVNFWQDNPYTLFHLACRRY